MCPLRISSFLREVAAESDTNKMGAGNLAVVFSPTVLRPKTQESTDHGKVVFTAVFTVVFTTVLTAVSRQCSRQCSRLCSQTL